MAWKDCVPSSCWSTATCTFVKEDASTAYVCTKEDAFIECCNGVIERSCVVNCSKAESIEQFFTYYPFMEYFLVKGDDTIVIISNAKDLKVCQIHKAINKYEIWDYKSLGYPQVKIWPQDDSKEPFIADFATMSITETTSANSDHSYICSRLQPKLKEAKHLLTINVKDLAAKRKLHIESMLRLMNNNSTKACALPNEMQNILGVKTVYKHSNLTKSDLELLYPWQMAVDMQWLLGLFVKNTNTRTISNLKIVLHDDNKGRICYTIKRLSSKNINEIFNRLELKTPSLPSKSVVVWEEEKLECKLSPGEGCFLLAITPFPDFTTASSVSISGQLSYSFGVNYEDQIERTYFQELPQFEITARCVLNGSVLPNVLHSEIFGVISKIAMYELVVLSISMGLGPSKALEQILVEEIGFFPIHEDNLFLHSGRSNPALSGCIIQIHEATKGNFQMRLHARSNELLVLLVYCILEVIPGSWDVKYACTKTSSINGNQGSATTMEQCSNATTKEITFLVSSMLNWERLHCSDKICIDLNTYRQFINVLTLLQTETDKVFSLLDFKSNKDDQITYH